MAVSGEWGGSNRGNSQKTSMLRVSTQWQSDGTSVSVLVEDMSINKCFFQVGISHVLLFISICDLFTDPLSYVAHVPFNSFFLTDHLILCSDLLPPPYKVSDAAFSASC
jgi:hypothetical protein